MSPALFPFFTGTTHIALGIIYNHSLACIKLFFLSLSATRLYIAEIENQEIKQLVLGNQNSSLLVIYLFV